MRMITAALLAALGLIATAQADTGKTPLVVEMFTSKYCPNCPMAEHKMKGVAADEADVLMIFEHVDYWDSDDHKDPYGLADVTQRQYDISGAMGKRAGEVYTPMPLIDGRIMVGNPLMFTWGSALEKGRALAEKPRLETTLAKNGDLTIKVPPALYGANRELWVLAVEPVEATKVWRVRGVVQGDLKQRDAGGTVSIASALLPKPYSYIALLEEAGPGAVVAMGSYGLQK